MAEAIRFARGRVTSVSEVDIQEKITASGVLPAVTITASVLLIEPLRSDSDPRVDCHGTITVPMQLPYGKSFYVTLEEHDGVVEGPHGRKFKDE